MSILDDLDDYKYETLFQTDPDNIIHTSYKVERARGFERVAQIETWSPQKPELGIGTFGTVRLEKRVGDNNGIAQRFRAVKKLRKSHLKHLNVDFRKELAALTKFTRPKYIKYGVFVEFYGWFEDDDSIFLAMEYIPNGTLDKYISTGMTEQDLKSISLQMATGLKVMHEEGFAHRDLKPQNVFVVQKAPKWWIKIGDFGISKRISNSDTVLRTATGTPNYLAPEVSHYVDGEDEESDSYTNACDIWSFACVVYETMTAQVPFPRYPRDLITFCKGGPFPEAPLAKRMSAEGIAFVRSILIPAPAQRPTAKDIIEAPWLLISQASVTGEIIQGSEESIKLDDEIPKPPAIPVIDHIAQATDDMKDARPEIPPGARWTKISRKLVNPEALELGKERFEARKDFVIVLRILTREEVRGYAEVTSKIRADRRELEEIKAAEALKERRARRARREEYYPDGRRPAFVEDISDEADTPQEREKSSRFPEERERRPSPIRWIDHMGSLKHLDLTETTANRESHHQTVSNNAIKRPNYRTNFSGTYPDDDREPSRMFLMNSQPMAEHFARRHERKPYDSLEARDGDDDDMNSTSSNNRDSNKVSAILSVIRGDDENKSHRELSTNINYLDEEIARLDRRGVNSLVIGPLRSRRDKLVDLRISKTPSPERLGRRY